MKRRFFFVGISLCIVVTILTGCGTLNNAVTTKTQGTVATEKTLYKAKNQSASEKLPASADNSSENDSKLLTCFDFSANEFVSVLNKVLKSQGFKSIIESQIIDEKNDDIYGKLKCYSYSLVAGGYLFVFESAASNKVVQIAVTADMNIISEDGLNEFAFCEGFAIGSVDSDTAQEIINKLDLNNMTKNGITSDTRKKGYYTYSVDGNDIMLLIDPIEY